MNSKHHARLMVQGKVFECADHDNELFRAEGIKLHKFVWSEVLKKTGQRQEAGVKATAELTAQEYSGVSSAMQADAPDTPGKSQKRKATPKLKAEETEEERNYKAAATERNKATSRVKSLIDKSLNEVFQLRKDVAKLEAKQIINIKS